MNRQDLYESMEHIDDAILTRSEGGRSRRRVWWMGGVAAVLVAALLGGLLLRPGSGPLTTNAYAVSQAVYPSMAPYPNEMDYADPLTGEFDSDGFSQVYDAWRESVRGQAQEKGYADSLTPFFTASIQQFLVGEPGENRACSPLNVYMALGMLAELTDGESRQQILDLLGLDSIEALRTQAQAVWNAHYRNDGATTSILASSLWLSQDVSFVPQTLDTLAQTYYASSYQGEMGSEGFNQALRDWLNDQTGGLLADQTGDLSLEPETVLALAATLYYQAKWSSEFNESKTAPQTFHAVEGDMTCDFMHSGSSGAYYWGDRFCAVGRALENGGGTMWFLLPDEGVSVEELLADPQAMAFLLSNGDWENRKDLIVNLSLPKFDISSQADLAEGLQALGVTDVFDPAASDFSPMTTELEGIYVSQVKHGVRVAVDEEGVTAAAYTVMAMSGSSAPPEDEVDVVLDRPFLFALTSPDGLPLFAGVVHQPG